MENYNIIYMICQIKKGKNNKKYSIKQLTNNQKWVIIISESEVRKMSRRRKSGKKDKRLETIILITATFNLIEALIEIIKELI